VLKARDEECPVTLEDLESGIEEAVGIIHWARELATSPGEVPPPMVIHALTCVINAKLKVKELAQHVDLSPLQAEVIERLAGELMDAVERAGIPEEYRQRLAEELRRIDSGGAEDQAG